MRVPSTSLTSTDATWHGRLGSEMLNDINSERSLLLSSSIVVSSEAIHVAPSSATNSIAITPRPISETPPPIRVVTVRSFGVFGYRCNLKGHSYGQPALRAMLRRAGGHS